MIITISGNPGSGKSTITKILIERLKCEKINAGGITREMAHERGITVEEHLKRIASEPEIDIEVDKRVAKRAREINNSGKDVIAEGRIQFHNLPESIKIYIYVNEEEGAKRILKDLLDKEASSARNQDVVKTVGEVIAKNRFREEIDAQRYLKLYGVDHRRLDNYDLIVNTTEISAAQAADKIIDYLNRVRKENGQNKIA